MASSGWYWGLLPLQGVLLLAHILFSSLLSYYVIKPHLLICGLLIRVLQIVWNDCSTRGGLLLHTAALCVTHSRKRYGVQMHTHCAATNTYTHPPTHTHTCISVTLESSWCFKCTQSESPDSHYGRCLVFCVFSHSASPLSLLYVMAGNFQPLREKLLWVVVSGKTLVKWD